MPRRREPLKPPREYVVKGQQWPYCDLVPGAPVAAAVLQTICVRARAEINRQGVTQHSVAAMANLDPSTLRLVLNGYKWPDMVTIVKMEQNLQASLWPHGYPTGGESTGEGASS